MRLWDAHFGLGKATPEEMSQGREHDGGARADADKEEGAHAVNAQAQMTPEWARGIKHTENGRTAAEPSAESTEPKANESLAERLK